MIGKLINEFDNSLGTIQDFNRLFPFAKLEDESGDVEILGIADNELIRNISVNGELRQHYFKCPISNIKTEKQSNYVYSARKGDIVKTFDSPEEAAKFFGKTRKTFVERYNNKTLRKQIDGWQLLRRKL